MSLSSSPKGSIASRGSRGRRTSKLPDISDKAIVLNLAGYAAKNGSLLREGERVVPITLSGLAYARRRRTELRNVSSSGFKLFSSPQSSEKKSLDTLFDCFRECPKLRVLQGSCSEDTVDLDDFISLTSLELSSVQLAHILNPPLGIREVTLTRSVVPVEQLGEAVTSLTLDSCMQAELSPASVARMASSLTRLTVRASLLPPKTLQTFLGADEWVQLRHVEMVRNELDMLPCLAQLPEVRHLSLTQNKILQVQNLHKCLKLVSLDLSNNEIASLEADAASLPPSITTLNLSKNRLQTLKGLASLPSLESLNVADNQLSQWGEVYQLLKASPVGRLGLKDNPGLRKVVRQYRPLVAGMVNSARWKAFHLDGMVLSGSDISTSLVRDVCAQFSEFFTVPDSACSAVVIHEDHARARVIDLSPDEDGVASFPSCDPELVSAACAGALVLLAHSSSCPEASPARGKGRQADGKQKRYKVVKKLVPKKKDDRRASEDQLQGAPPAAAAARADAGDDVAAAVDSESQPSPSRPAHDRSEASEASATDGPLTSSAGNGSAINVPQPRERLEVVVARSLSDSNGEDLLAKRAQHALPCVLHVDDPQVESLTSPSFLSFVRMAAKEMSPLLSAGTIVPRLTRLAPGPIRGTAATARLSPSTEFQWGDVVVSTAREAPPCFSVALHPPNDVCGPSATRLVAVDATTTDTHLTIRIRSGLARRSTAPSGDGVVGDHLCGVDGGLQVTWMETFKGYGVADPAARATINLVNVQTWEVGEAKPWDVKKVTVPPGPSPDLQFTTTFGGTTYLQRRQQADVRASFLFASEITLLAGFEVPNAQCEARLVDMLKDRLRTCVRAPQWPVVINLRLASSTTVQKTFEQFRRDVEGVEDESTEDVRAGSKLQEDTRSSNDLFIYFGSTLAGRRQPDYDMVAQYGIKKGIHILGVDDAEDEMVETAGEKLVASCYCNVLLGNVSNEQEEKSCWIAMSNTDTYFCLDLNYRPREGRRSKVPLAYLASHKNSDLSKVELGYSWQYMRLVYGGVNGMTYLLLPRSKSTCVRLLSCLSTARGASSTGLITVHGSPFASRPLVDGQAELRGYFLVYMRQDQLVQRRKNRETTMSFPQDVYPLREMAMPMLPVSIVVTKDDVMVATDRYASWPDGEVDANRWHLEKRSPLGDIVGIWAARAADDHVFPTRFEIEFESDSDERIRWKFAAQTPAAMRDCTHLIKSEYENKWGGGTVKLNIEPLQVSD